MVLRMLTNEEISNSIKEYERVIPELEKEVKTAHRLLELFKQEQAWRKENNVTIKDTNIEQGFKDGL